MLKKYGEKYTDQLYFVFRVLVGLLFFQHGAQKLLGWFGGEVAAINSLIGLSGIIELVGGLAIALGLFTRVAAFVSLIEMAIAYFRAHAPQGLIPIVNRGELAALYFATFLVLLAFGARKWGLEKKLFKKELF